jgi:Protein of unknown function (DUF3047)
LRSRVFTAHGARRALGALLAACAVATLAQNDAIVVSAFSALKPGAALPVQWQPVGISNSKNATRYTLVEDAGVTVLRAEANGSVSGLVRRLHVDPAQTPLLHWRWKIANVLQASDIRSKAGDDFPARVYVMFDYPLNKLSFAERVKIRLVRALYDPHVPTATLCYVWDGKAPAGTMVPSSYSHLVRMVVVESGASRVNQWLAVERNVAADFRAAFGEVAPTITAVAVATDTDNTGEAAAAFYGDISFNKQKVTR